MAYKIIKKKDMPKGPYEERYIKNLSSMDWAITGDYNKLAKNHCGAVTITNLGLYLMGQNPRLEPQSKDYGFRLAHRISGNGPIAFLRPRIKRYFKDNNLKIKSRRIKNLKTLKLSIKNNKPSTMLISGGIFAWHWVIVVGYRFYSDGQVYLRIVDNWRNNSSNYYRLGKFISHRFIREYWL